MTPITAHTRLALLWGSTVDAAFRRWERPMAAALLCRTFLAGLSAWTCEASIYAFLRPKCSLWRKSLDLSHVQIFSIRTVERSPRLRSCFVNQPQSGIRVFCPVGSSFAFVEAVFHKVIDVTVFLRPDPDGLWCSFRHGQGASENECEKCLNQ